MGGDSDATDVLQAAIERQPIFQELRGGGSTRAEIQAALDVSRSTTHRIVNRFESMGVVARENGAYELTSFGRVVANEAERATSTVEVADHLSGLLETLEAADEAVELHLFEDATVTEPEPGDPYQPMRRLLSLVEDAASIRDFGPTAPEPAYQTTLFDRVSEGLRATVLYPPSVVQHLHRDSEPALQEALADGDFALRIGKTPGFRLLVADEHVYLGGYNDDASRLEVVADTAAEDAVDWATDCFRQRWQEATPYEQYCENRN